MKLEPGIRYIVTKGNATFRKGEHIRLDLDGAILCAEAGGWIDKEDAEAAMWRVEVAPDLEWAAMARAELRQRLDELDKIEGGNNG